jgi:hypothetical protein
MVIFRLPAAVSVSASVVLSVSASVAVSIAVVLAASVAAVVSVAVSVAVVGFAFGSFSAFFEELFHSGDLFRVNFFVVSAIGFCLLGLGDLAMDGQPEMLGIFENHHRGAELFQVRTWRLIEVLFNKVRGLLEDAVEAVVVVEESLVGCHDGFLLSRGEWGSLLRSQNGRLRGCPFARGMGESLGPGPWERAGGMSRPRA